jgi:hypothetical protein
LGSKIYHLFKHQKPEDKTKTIETADVVSLLNVAGMTVISSMVKIEELLRQQWGGEKIIISSLEISEAEATKAAIDKL